MEIIDNYGNVMLDSVLTGGVKMFSKVNTFGISGARAFQVFVEADISKGIPYFDVVGLGNEAVKESRKRVRAAIVNGGYQFPLGRITLNLAPAGMRKQGTYLDLAIAVGILRSAGVIKRNIDEFAVVGELSLNGDVKPVKGILPMIVLGIKKGIKKFIVPYENGNEARSARVFDNNVNVYTVKSLNDAVSVLLGDKLRIYECLSTAISNNSAQCFDKINLKQYDYDFCNILGQESAKRALEVAAAGHHNVLMMGSAGSGKTMMARALRSIMKPLSIEESFEVSQIYSIAGLNDEGVLSSEIPFRAVHCGVTRAALVGGGRPPELGEISLAHNGILFIDELSEVSRSAIEALRQPLEDRFIRLSNCGVREILPADFMLVGASNPCPCGNLYEPEGVCTCSPSQIRNYTQKISVPILDRIDIHIPVTKVKISDASEENSAAERSFKIRERLSRAIEMQEKRYSGESFKFNSGLTGNSLHKYCTLDKNTKALLSRAADSMGFSMRACGKIIKVARTIADIDGREKINEGDMAEALQYRCFDRQVAV